MFEPYSPVGSYGDAPAADWPIASTAPPSGISSRSTDQTVAPWSLPTSAARTLSIRPVSSRDDQEQIAAPPQRAIGRVATVNSELNYIGQVWKATSNADEHWILLPNDWTTSVKFGC